MTTGSVLYLLMSIAMFTAFSVVLAYQSWQQTRPAPKMQPGLADPPDTQPIVTT